MFFLKLNLGLLGYVWHSATMQCKDKGVNIHRTQQRTEYLGLIQKAMPEHLSGPGTRMYFILAILLPVLNGSSLPQATSALRCAVLTLLTMHSVTIFPLRITYQPKLKPKHCRRCRQGEGETEQSAPLIHHRVLDTAGLCQICWVQPWVTHYKVLVC